MKMNYIIPVNLTIPVILILYCMNQDNLIEGIDGMR
jgi:hypothetical protein